MAADYPLLPQWQAIEDRRALDRRAANLEVRADSRRVSSFRAAKITGEDIYTYDQWANVFDNFSPYMIEATDIAPLVSQRLLFTAVELPAGEAIESVLYQASTHATGVVNRWACIANAEEVLGFTEVYTDDAPSYYAVESYDFASPFIVPQAGLYFVGICTRATTMPEFYGRRPHVNAMLNSLFNFYVEDTFSTQPASYSLSNVKTSTDEVPYVRCVPALAA